MPDVVPQNLIKTGEEAIPTSSWILTVKGEKISGQDVLDALHSKCEKQNGEFWDVYIPAGRQFVIKVARKPSDEFYENVQREWMLLSKYIGTFLPAQEIFRTGNDIILVQEMIRYPFQVSLASFERMFSRDLILLKFFLLISPQYKERFRQFLHGLEKMHADTGKMIDLWGSGNLVFGYPGVHESPVLVDTNFLFWKEERERPDHLRDDRMMNEAYNKSFECFTKLKTVIER